MSIGDYITSGLGRLQDNLFQVDPNVAGSMSPTELKGARNNALLHLGLGIIAGNRNGNGLGRAALLGLSEAENSFGQQTGLAYQLNRQKAQDAEADQTRALQMATLTGPGLGRLAGGLDAAPDKAAAWHSIIGNPTNVTLLKAAGIDPANVTPENLPQIMQQMHTQSALYSPHAPLVNVAPGGSLVDENTGKALFTAPDKPPAVPSELQEYELAKNQGFKGSFLQYKQELASQAARASQAAQGMTGFGPAADAAIKNGVTGDEFLKTLPSTQANIVKALADGRMSFPAGFALKSPYWQQMISAVSQYDHTFDAVNFNSRASTRKDFTSGKSSQNIKALNTAIGHLGTLASQIPGTASHSLTWFNSLSNATAQATGNAGPTQFKQTAGALASELTNVFRGSGGAEADVKRYLDELDVNASAAQKAAAVRNITELLHSRIEAIGDQYTKGMGKSTDPLFLLDPKAQGIITRLGSDANAPAPKTVNFSDLP